MSALEVEAVIADLKRRRQLLDDAIEALTAYQEGKVRPAAPLNDSVRPLSAQKTTKEQS